MTSPMPTSPLRQALQDRWQTLGARERALVRVAAIVLALALLWWLALAPALDTLRRAPARHAQLDAQLQHLRALQAEAQQLQAQARSEPGDTQAALRRSLAQTLGGSAQLNLLGERATVTLQAAPAQALAQWLLQARSNAHATPVEARLTRSAAASAGAGAEPRWDGTLVLALPQPPAN